MKSPLLNGEVIIHVLVINFLFNVGSGHSESKCSITFSVRLKCTIAFCNDLHLNKVPSDINNHIECLDLGYNNIFILKNSSFIRYSKLKYLYLTKNGLGEIDDKAFLPLTRLIHLDLSANSLIILPTYLPPSLQELNLDFNPRLFVKSNEPKLPEMESLQKLFLSQNYIETFPKFVHNIPSLEELDLTDNSIRTLMLEDLAPMCNLRILNVSTESLFVSESMLCDCLRVQSWITSKKINVPSKFTCNNRNNEDSQCDLRPSNNSIIVNDNCVTTSVRKNLLRKLIAGGTVLVGLIIIIFLLYCCCRKKSGMKNPNHILDQVKYKNYIKDQST